MTADKTATKKKMTTKKVAESAHKKISKSHSDGDKGSGSSLQILFGKKGGAKAETAVYFSSQKKKGESSSVAINNAAVAKHLAAAIEGHVISGKPKETTLFRESNWEGYRNTLIIGLGSSSDGERFRQAGAAIFKGLQGAKTTSADIFLDGAPLGSADSATVIQALTEGISLAAYNLDELKSKKQEGMDLTITIHSGKGGAGAAKAVETGKTVAEVINFSRRLGDMPGNLMTPTIFADTVVDYIKGTGIKATIWDKKRIEKENMGGLLGVARGSREEPRFIILEYNGAAASKKPIVFVGKGLTFDTGGISIKPSAAMEEMKYDMCGGANVIGALIAIAKLKLKVNAIALVPSTENMPGGAATKPGDIHRARNGKTFEVNNTDAEGRLILSDALSYGSELKPEIMVDAATLTGAMVVALGNTHTGFFTRDEKLADRVNKAGKNSGEWVWRMPLTDFHVDDMKGTWADLSNISSSKGAGSATAAAFLEQFVGEGIPWAHFDIAGTGWAVGNRLNYCTPKGASGCMIRTFVELARQFEK